MPSYIGGMSACDARSKFSARRRKLVGSIIKLPHPSPLPGEAFKCKPLLLPPSLKWCHKLCLPLLLFVLSNCLPVNTEHGGTVVSVAFQDPGHAQNKTAVLLSEYGPWCNETGLASVPSKGKLCGSCEVDAKEGTAEAKEERQRHLLPLQINGGSLEKRQEHDEPIESDIDVQDADFEIASPEGSSNFFLEEKPPLNTHRGVHESTALRNSADAVRVHPNVSVLVVARTPSDSESVPFLQTSSTAHLTGPLPESANEKSMPSTPNVGSSSRVEHSAAQLPQQSTSSFSFSLQDALRFPSSLLVPLRAAFAPSTPPPGKTATSTSRTAASGRLNTDNRQRKPPRDGHKRGIQSAAELLRVSLRWSNSLAEDIQRRILELAAQKSRDNLVNKSLLRLARNVQRSFAAKDDPAREVDENREAPTGGADSVRKMKKPLPPFDKQTRKHMSYVRDWFAVSVGATMNGMRDQDEDALVVSAALQNFPNARMFSLFDGHAGQEAARRCSANASRVFGRLNGLTPPALKQACLELDERIRNYPGPCLKSGSTGVIAIVKALESPSGTLFDLHLANVGDSRAFLLHMTDNTYEILTRDHKPNQVEELQRIQKAGGCVRRIHKRVWRVNGFLALSRSFGDFALKRVASKTPEEQQVTAVPGTSTATARPGDYLLLGCDGVFEGEGMSWDFVARLLKESIEFFSGDIASIVNHLIDIAFALGSRDNISILLIKFTNKKLATHVKRFEIEVDGTARELPVEIISGQEVSTSMAGVYKRDQSLLVTLFS